MVKFLKRFWSLFSKRRDTWYPAYLFKDSVTVSIRGNRHITIEIVCEVLFNQQQGTWAARIRELGLTGYGTNNALAITKVRLMLASLVQAHEMNGTLERFLEAARVNWRWSNTGIKGA